MVEKINRKKWYWSGNKGDCKVQKVVIVKIRVKSILEVRGFEPLTPWMPFKCSPSWATPPCENMIEINQACVKFKLWLTFKDCILNYNHLVRVCRRKTHLKKISGQYKKYIVQIVYTVLFLSNPSKVQTRMYYVYVVAWDYGRKDPEKKKYINTFQ